MILSILIIIFNNYNINNYNINNSNLYHKNEMRYNYNFLSNLYFFCVSNIE